MGAIAKGEITLSPVNDAYTVSLSPNTSVIKLDGEGNPIGLDDVRFTVSISRGNKTIPFYVQSIVPENCTIQTIPGSANVNAVTSIVASLSAIDNQKENGGVEITVQTEDNYTTTVRWSYTVVTDLAMLDWIQDWEGSKTKVGDSYIMTPKLFIGNKEEITNETSEGSVWRPGELTGVYIGPDMLSENSVGLYGYQRSQEIFHLNAQGGLIGGWTMANTEISSGRLSLKSTGAIEVVDEGVVRWGIYEDGNAIFSKGNVVFNTDGSAEYKGKIIASSGQIGDWHIGEHSIFHHQMFIDGKSRLIGIYNSPQNIDYDSTPIEISASNCIDRVKSNGGVLMHFTNSLDYGVEIWRKGSQTGIGVISTASKVFSAGSENLIGGWYFDNNSIYIGDKNNTKNAYTAQNSITIGTNGLRGSSWYINKDGSFSFFNGKLILDNNNGSFVGWKLRDDAMASSHLMLINQHDYTGLYLTAMEAIDIPTEDIQESLCTYGGAKLTYRHGTGVEFVVYRGLGSGIEPMRIVDIQQKGWSSIAKGAISWYANRVRATLSALSYKNLTPSLNSETVSLDNDGVVINLNNQNWDGKLPEVPSDITRKITIIWWMTDPDNPTSKNISGATSNVLIRIANDEDTYAGFDLKWGTVFDIYGFQDSNGHTIWLFPEQSGKYTNCVYPNP